MDPAAVTSAAAVSAAPAAALWRRFRGTRFVARSLTTHQGGVREPPSGGQSPQAGLLPGRGSRAGPLRLRGPGRHRRQLSPPLSDAAGAVTQTARHSDPTRRGSAAQQWPRCRRNLAADGDRGHPAAGHLPMRHRPLDHSGPAARGAGEPSPSYPPSEEPRCRAGRGPYWRSATGLVARPGAVRHAAGRSGRHSTHRALAAGLIEVLQLSASASLAGRTRSQAGPAPDCRSLLANSMKKTQSFRHSRGRPAGPEATGPRRDARDRRSRPSTRVVLPARNLRVDCARFRASSTRCHRRRGPADRRRRPGRYRSRRRRKRGRRRRSWRGRRR
jgi:hypothetical protein